MTGMVNTVSTARKPREVVSIRQTDEPIRSMNCAKARSHNSKRTAIIVTLVSACLAVAVTAGIVMLVTQGRGTDHIILRPPPPQTTKRRPTRQSNQNNGLPQPGITDTVRMIPHQDSTSGSSTTAPIQARPGSTGTDSSTDSNTNGSTDGSTGADSSTNSGTTGGSTGSAPPEAPPAPATVQPDRVQDQPMARFLFQLPRADHPVQTPVIAVQAAPQPVAAEGIKFIG